MNDSRDEDFAAALLAAAQAVAQLRMESIAHQIIIAGLLRGAPDRQRLLSAVEEIAARTPEMAAVTLTDASEEQKTAFATGVRNALAHVVRMSGVSVY